MIFLGSCESGGKTPAKPRRNAESISNTTDKENSLSVSELMKAIGKCQIHFFIRSPFLICANCSYGHRSNNIKKLICHKTSWHHFAKNKPLNKFAP